MMLPRLKHYLSNKKHHFAIGSNLLGDTNVLAWSNLGYWLGCGNNTRDYITACQQLADQVAQAAQLQANDHLLDLGCGQGASLQHWASQYGVKRMAGFELQPACVANIQHAIAQQQLPKHTHIYPARFDQLPLPNDHLKQAFDAVVCVDAAYHAKTSEFLAVAQTALKPNGRLAFTTLMKSDQWHRAPIYLQRLTTRILQAALIAPQNLLSQSEFERVLAQTGFTAIQINPLDSAVLQGFAQFIQGHHPHVALNQKLDWLKIQLTARLCAFLYRHGLVHYVLINAQLNGDQSDA